MRVLRIQQKQPTATEVPAMYALQADDGTWATGRYGRFTYGTHQLALTAAKILGKKHGRRYRVVEA